MSRIALAIVMAIVAGATCAAETQTPSPAPSAASGAYSTTLDTMHVIGQRLFPYQEGMVLDEKYIDSQVKGNGDIATLLRINPNVQFDDSASTSSRQMGEIRPAEISINGGQYYQNLFQLDGASFNNDLDPQSSNPHDLADVPSVTQGIALDTDLIGSLTVYDSNVPAAFGGFSGGVVDAESRKAGDALAGRIYFRMARSVWDEQFAPGTSDFLQSTTYSNQPVYDKYKISAMLEGRTRNGIGIIGSLARIRSEIPLHGYSGGTSSNDERIKEQRRENTSASLRADWASGDGIELGASLTYAPTDERYFTKNAKNAYFDLKQGGPVASFRAAFGLGGWNLRNSVSYSDLESSRRVDSSIDYWKGWARSPEFDWGVNNNSYEGNWGNIDQTTRNIGYKLVAEHAPLQWGASTHGVQLGLEYRDRKATYHRLNDHYSFLSPAATTTCTDANGVVDTDACSLSPVYTTVTNGVAAGKGQYFRTMNIYSAGYFEVAVREWSAFLQDDIRVGNFSLRPGLRVDSDDLMEKDSIAPRFAMSWDVFGNQRTLMTAGANRYYGRNMFSYKLREGRDNLQTTYTRTAGTLLWKQSKQYTSTNRFEGLDIPYSDELNFGINQRWAGLDFNFKFVNREGRDEVLRQRVASNDDSGYYSSNVYQYVNAGRSSSDIYTLSIGQQRPWRWHGSSNTAQLGFDYTDVRRNFSSYETAYTDGSYNRLVRYEGKIIRAYDIPQDSFNRPWSARLSTQTRIDDLGLLWSNFLRYRAGHRATISNGAEEYNGETIDVIDNYDYPGSWTWDSTLEYAIALPERQQLYVRAEIQNLLNRKNLIYSGSTESSAYYEPGRSYWLELGYRF